MDSDVAAIIGTDAELARRLSSEDCEGVWYKDGNEVRCIGEATGSKPMKIQWYHEGEELLEDTNIKIERSSSHTCLVLNKCRRKTSGEIKIKIKNECGATELTGLVVLGVCAAVLSQATSWSASRLAETAGRNLAT